MSYWQVVCSEPTKSKNKWHSTKSWFDKIFYTKNGYVQALSILLDRIFTHNDATIVFYSDLKELFDDKRREHERLQQKFFQLESDVSNRNLG